MSWKWDVAIGVGSFMVGLAAGVAVGNLHIEPEWARRVMSRIRVGCVARFGQVHVEFIGTGKWEPDETGVSRDAAYYLVWSVGQGVYDLQGHIELAAPSQTKDYYTLEFYHAYTCPVQSLVETDLQYRVEYEDPHLVVLSIFA